MQNTNTAAARKNSVFGPTSEAQRTLTFWQALEYLVPQAPPKDELKLQNNECVWALEGKIDGDDEMPWKDPAKREASHA